jgi:HlyD family secretion protein
MLRWRKRLLVIAGIVVIVLVLSQTAFRGKPVPVTVQRVDRGRVEDTVVNSRAGTVESRYRARMSPAVPGLVRELPVEKGERVRRGQVLLGIEDGEYRHQVALAQRSFDAARAAADQACLAAEQAARDLVRAEALAAKALLSEKGLEDARTNSDGQAAACRSARENARQAQAAIGVAQANLDKCTMLAPFDGVVLDIKTEVGEWISPAPPGVVIPAVIDLVAPESLYVTAPLDEADVARVRLGQPARITFDAFRGEEFPGRLTYISSFVETRQEQNRTLTVEAVFTSRDLPPNLLPGLSADLEVILEARDDVLRIPASALLEGERVLLVREGKLVDVPVNVGLRNWQYAEVVQGLSAGDPVVVSLDRVEVKAGARAKIASEIGRQGEGDRQGEAGGKSGT